MKVLVIGAGGQLGSALMAAAPDGVVATGLSRQQLDLTNTAAIAAAVEAARPDCVLNAAAYTAVDKAESERSEVHSVNALAVRALAQACCAHSSRLIHISTDFVFDGNAGRPYRVDDAPNPLSVYGASKLAGELHVRECDGLDWRIIRTAWVYSGHGKNFLLTMLRLCRERTRVEVVTDQVGTPTSAKSLAECVWRAAIDEGPPSVFHFTDAGVASWYDFAVAIYEEARGLRLIARDVEIVPITSAQYVTPARRPTYSVLDKSQTLQRLNITPVHWRVRLREVLQEMSV